MEATVTSSYDAYQDIHNLRVKEGEREITVMASEREGRIKFCFHNIKRWECPFHEDPFTEEDRARLATRIADHYTAEGWHVEIDRRRFCPRCLEKLAGSEREDWPGGACDFCGREADRFGDIPVISLPPEGSTAETGLFKRLKNSLRRFAMGGYGPPPPPDLSDLPSYPHAIMKEVIYSDSKHERAIITIDGMGRFTVFVQWWDTSEWSAGHRAFWHGQHRCGYALKLKSAQRLAGEALLSVAHYGS